MVTPPPRQLGRYQILDEIGRGAMGLVYLARDPLIGRLVALKTFQVGLSADDEEAEVLRARFIREAQSAGILSHPNIVTIHDVVERSDEGATFIAMEYVRGTDLKKVLQAEGPLSLEEASGILSQIAAGLDYAHSKGVVHRDVKPANVLLTAERQVKITDFGIARMGSSNLTQDGQLLGTPNYMAPEQIKGEETDHRADVFSLGVLCYEMLTCEKPFRGENLTAVSHRIVYDPPTAFADLGRDLGDLPEGVETILSQAMTKDPSERYASTRELAGAIAGALARLRLEESLNQTQVVDVDLTKPPAAADSTAWNRRVPPPPPVPAGPARPARPAGPPSPPGPSLGERLRAGAGQAMVAGRALVESLSRRSWHGREAAARPTNLRLALLAVVTLVAAVLVGGMLLASAHVRGGEIEPEPPEHRQRVDARDHLKNAYLLLDSGAYGDALEELRQAEADAPDIGHIVELRQEIAVELRRLDQVEERVLLIEEGLTAASTALDERRWPAALEEAEGVLEIDPGNEQAENIVELAASRMEQDRELRRRRQADAERQAEREQAEQLEAEESLAAAAAAAAAREQLPVDGDSTGSAAAQGDATLEIDFWSELPEGTLIVYLDGAQIVRREFRFYKRGLFRSRAQTGGFSERVTVSPGQHEVRLWVAREGEAPEPQALTRRFGPGEGVRLTGRLDSDGRLRVRFE